MIEIITHERVGLPAIQAAGEGIAADAAANMRMAEVRGGATMAARNACPGMDAIERAKAEIEMAEKAWSTFKDASGHSNAFDPAPNEALATALNEIRRHLDQI